MAAPQNRVPVRVARGTKGNLDAALALGSLKEGELIYAKDENILYVVESGVLIPATTNLAITSVDSLSDVDTTSSSPTDGQVLTWNQSSSNWVPDSLPNDLPVGGTTGQILAKASGTDYDTEWVDDSTGTGIPAGGSTGQVLAKASATDYDTEWATPTAGAAPDVPGFIALGENSPLSLSGSGNAVVTFTSIPVDRGGYFASNRYTPQVAGLYFFSVQAYQTTTVSFELNVLKNGGGVVIYSHSSSASLFPLSASGHVYLNGTTDYVEFIVSKTASCTLATRRFSGHLVSAF